jgi:hypothetical protein
MRMPRVRWGYATAAVVVAAVSVLWWATVTYSCADVGTAVSDCEPQGGVEMVARTIVAVIGLGVAVWLAVRAFRRPTTPR